MKPSPIELVFWQVEGELFSLPSRVIWRKTMEKKHKSFILAAVLAVSAFSLAQANTAVAGSALDEPYWTSDGFIQVADGDHNRMEWNRHRDGDRCLHRRGDCRHFYRGYYYVTPWWTLPLVVGDGYNRYYGDDYDDGYDGLSSAHVEWCLDHYRSYNPRTNTWVSYGGVVHECISPYA
jgi:hypothetical protein